MITLVEHKTVANYIGMSDDTKPTAISDAVGMPNGSRFIEMDTGKKYFWNADALEWVELPESGSGSGGGGGGVLVVGVTVTTGSHSEEIYTLDKTWQEIHDAYMGGSLVYINFGDSETSASYYMVTRVAYFPEDPEGPEGSLHGVEIFARTGASEFWCNSASGYPSYISI